MLVLPTTSRTTLTQRVSVCYTIPMSEKYVENAESEKPVESQEDVGRKMSPEEIAADIKDLHNIIAEREEFLQEERVKLDEIRSHGPVSEVIAAEFAVQEIIEELENLKAFLEAAESGEEMFTRPME